MSGALLEAWEVARAFGATRALAGVTLSISPGELYGLVGPDGAGKTTAMRLFTGVMKPDAGRVRVLGEDPARGSRRVREAMGYMPQQYSLYGDLSVEENLRFFAELFGIGRAAARERSERLLAITRLAPFLDRRADALSGGMYKKLALACALLHRPRLLLLDEPTNGVDPVSRRELWALLYELVAGGMAIVVSTPYMDEAERCHRVGLIHEGRLVAEDAPAALVRSFEAESYEIAGGAREAVLAAIEGLPGVLSRSPAGARLRVVVRRGGAPGLEAALRATGARLLQLRPGFEDVFIARARRGP